MVDSAFVTQHPHHLLVPRVLACEQLQRFEYQPPLSNVGSGTLQAKVAKVLPLFLTDECLIRAVEREVQLIGSGHSGAGGLYIYKTHFSRTSIARERYVLRAWSLD